MSDFDFEKLKGVPVPDPSEGAEKAAMKAAMFAFDEQHSMQDKQNPAAPKDRGWWGRLLSIRTFSIGDWTMDIRIPIATAAAGLLLVPLSLQLFNSTAISPTFLLPTAQSERSEPRLEIARRSQEQADGELGGSANAGQVALTEAAPVAEAVAEQANAPSSAKVKRDDGRQRPVKAAPPPAPSLSRPEAQNRVIQPLGALSEAEAPGTIGAIVAQNPTQGDRFAAFDRAPVNLVADSPVSTFSIDVDTASYAYVRRALEDGYLPPPDAVRVEELINYFNYDYAAPGNADAPFAPTVAVYPSPWREGAKILHIGIKGYAPEQAVKRASNIVLLIDTSGSMDAPDKLPLLKRAFGMLVNQLDENDSVSIVTYAGNAGVVLSPTPASQKAKILAALDRLEPGGSTAGAAGIEQAYRLAAGARIEGGENRVILATDGDFNVGISSPDELESFIAAKRDEGTYLSVLGFGSGNYNDALMQALAQNGNGNAAYIDSFSEARKVLVEEAGATLVTIAKDVKIQVEFNPAIIEEYRLVGYETRALRRQDFNNDRVDAGEIGAGHTVTALYEIVPVGSGASLVDPLRYGGSTNPQTEISAPGNVAAFGEELAFVKLRYKLPDEDISRLIERAVTSAAEFSSFDEVPADMRFAAAVASFGQKLAGGPGAPVMGFDEIAEMARNGRGPDRGGYRAEFIALAELAKVLTK
jgi:Ca-activated chloride channel homolog